MRDEPPFLCEKGKLLREFSTFKIGGPARYFAIATTATQMQEMLLYTHQSGLTHFVLGKGSNCLFDDRGFNGLIILNRIDFLKQKEGIFTAGSGYSFARLGKKSAKLGWAGLEFAAAIPATVGGAIFMNAGAGRQETADSLLNVEYVTEKGNLIRFEKDELFFSYRTSLLQQWKGAIVEGTFALKKSEVALKFQKKNLSYRLETQPYRAKSAGCVFQNPKEEVFAGQLIEACGLKGYRIGGAEVSKVHANFLINSGKAKATDILALIQFIKERVFQEKGLYLREEIRYIPYYTNSV